MATAEGHGKKMITLISEDGENFEVEAAVAMESQTILHMIEDDCVDNGIKIHRVKSNILSMVIEYCTRHVQAKPAPDASNGIAGTSNAPAPTFPTEDLKNWDTKFIKVGQATLFDLIMAANYLDIKGLLNLALENVANMIKGKTPEEIRETFHIKNDFTAAEEEEIKRENQWVFE